MYVFKITTIPLIRDLVNTYIQSICSGRTCAQKKWLIRKKKLLPSTKVPMAALNASAKGDERWSRDVTHCGVVLNSLYIVLCFPSLAPNILCVVGQTIYGVNCMHADGHGTSLDHDLLLQHCDVFDVSAQSTSKMVERWWCCSAAIVVVHDRGACGDNNTGIFSCLGDVKQNRDGPPRAGPQPCRSKR